MLKLTLIWLWQYFLDLNKGAKEKLKLVTNGFLKFFGYAYLSQLR